MRQEHHHDAPAPFPMLDIGGDVGAMVVRIDQVPPGGELHAHPVGQPQARFHTGVHPRVQGDQTFLAAVYPEVVEGEYELEGSAGPLATLTVEGGSVAEITVAWR